jgi:hypothetical protein
VDRVRIVGDVNVPIRQLLTKSYRPRTCRLQRRRQVGEPACERFWTEDQRLPEPLALRGIKRREDLAPPRIQDGEVGALPPLDHPTPKRIEGADAAGEGARARRQPPGRRQPDPDPDKRARTPSNGDQPHSAPATTGSRRALYLGEQGG